MQDFMQAHTLIGTLKPLLRAHQPGITPAVRTWRPRAVCVRAALRKRSESLVLAIDSSVRPQGFCEGEDLPAGPVVWRRKNCELWEQTHLSRGPEETLFCRNCQWMGRQFFKKSEIDKINL